jgi:hypothetical protein
MRLGFAHASRCGEGDIDITRLDDPAYYSCDKPCPRSVMAHICIAAHGLLISSAGDHGEGGSSCNVVNRNTPGSSSPEDDVCCITSTLPCATRRGSVLYFPKAPDCAMAVDDFS